MTTIGEAPRGVVALDHIAGARPASVRQSPWVAITAALAVTGDVLSGGTAVAVWSATTSDRPRDLTVTVALLCSAVGWAVLLRALRGRVAVVRLGSSLRLVLKAAVSTAAALALLSYGIPALDARSLTLLALPVAVAGTLAGRTGVVLATAMARRRGMWLHRVLVAGEPRQVDRTMSALERHPRADTQVVGLALNPERVASAASAADADTVLLRPWPQTRPEDLRRLSWELQHRRIRLVLLPGSEEIDPRRLTVDTIGGVPVVDLAHPAFDGARRALKSAVDRSLGALLLAVVAPLFGAVAIVVRLTSPGPAFYRQVRVGRGGRPFSIYKFRTMFLDADRRKEELAHLNKCADGLLFKATEDPRVTPIGRLLRRWSLDELPQLINVVRGEMSLVGPRPAVPAEVEQYDEVVRGRLAVKPGLTGLWQVSGRSDLPWADAVRLDLSYVDNWSLLADAGILARTASAVVKGSGAY